MFTFSVFKKDVHESLTSKDMNEFFKDVEKTARDLPTYDITVFLDEINTTSVIGVFKEILSDHSICGRHHHQKLLILTPLVVQRVANNKPKNLN